MRESRSRITVVQSLAAVAIALVCSSTLPAQYVHEDVRLEPSFWLSGSGFGKSVSLSNGTAAIGAFSDPRVRPLAGSVYIYETVGGNWQETAALAPADLEDSDQFGWSVDLDGDFLIVGSRFDDDADHGDPYCQSGSAYVFRRINSVWHEITKLVASSAACADEFGYAVAVHDDVAVVGAPGSDLADSKAGAVYVYRLEGSQWLEEAVLTAAQSAPRAQFGCSVALHDDLLVVGALSHDGDGARLRVHA